MSTNKMRERWVEFMRHRGFSGNVIAEDAVKAAMDFAESEVRLVLQPREQPTCPRCGGTGSDVSRYPIAGCGCTQAGEGKE
jgi:hypothetical protein